MSTAGSRLLGANEGCKLRKDANWEHCLKILKECNDISLQAKTLSGMLSSRLLYASYSQRSNGCKRAVSRCVTRESLWKSQSVKRLRLT